MYPIFTDAPTPIIAIAIGVASNTPTTPVSFTPSPAFTTAITPTFSTFNATPNPAFTTAITPTFSTFNATPSPAFSTFNATPSPAFSTFNATPSPAFSTLCHIAPVTTHAVNISQTQYDILTRYNIGYEPAYAGCSSRAQVLQQYAQSKPGAACQMFLVSTETSTGKKPKSVKASSEELRAMAQVISMYNMRYFTHSPFTINLATDPNNKAKPWMAGWMQKQLTDNIIMTVNIGGRGTVVHVGKYKDFSMERGLDLMERMTRNALVHATEYCPLLIETPAGQGTELCVQIESLAAFFMRFNSEELKRLGVCIDTAHVWGAGYDPIYYLQTWVTNSPVPIRLVHFNDSGLERGSLRDVHAEPGHGYIGIEQMTLCAQFCQSRNIPMVYE